MCFIILWPTVRNLTKHIYVVLIIDTCRVSRLTDFWVNKFISGRKPHGYVRDWKRCSRVAYEVMNSLELVRQCLLSLFSWRFCERERERMPNCQVLGSGNHGFASFCEIGKIFSYHHSSNYLRFNSFNIPFNSTTLSFLSFPFFFFQERVWCLLIGEKRKKEKCYFLFALFFLGAILLYPLF